MLNFKYFRNIIKRVLRWRLWRLTVWRRCWCLSNEGTYSWSSHGWGWRGTCCLVSLPKPWIVVLYDFSIDYSHHIRTTLPKPLKNRVDCANSMTMEFYKLWEVACFSKRFKILHIHVFFLFLQFSQIDGGKVCSRRYWDVLFTHSSIITDFFNSKIRSEVSENGWFSQACQPWPRRHRCSFGKDYCCCVSCLYTVLMVFFLWDGILVQYASCILL